jgi:hypothetical protein
MQRLATFVAALILTSCAAQSFSPAGPRTATGSGSASVERPRGEGKTAFTASGRYIDLNGAHFFVKGVDYWPTPIGKKPWDEPGLNDALRDGNKAIWERDLPLLRKMGANAIRVYNVVPPPYDKDTGPISDFLNAAWNNGDHPIYVLMTIHFAAEKLLDEGAVDALASQYRDLDKKYAGYPAVMGTTMSNEIMGSAFISNAQWWKGFNAVARAAKQGFADGGNADKLVITADYDPVNAAGIRAGEQNGAAVDAWGLNVFRGRTFTNLYSEIGAATKKPVLVTEYSAPASYHPDLKNTYSWKTGPWPGGIGQCSPSTPDGPLNRNAAELPETGNPRMAGLVDYVTNNASLLYSGFKDDDGIVSGGFVLEWTDEWWKAQAGNDSIHSGSPTFTGHFPGCTYDEGWFVPRATLAALEKTWSSEP